MACFSIATTSADVRVTVPEDVLERVAKALLGEVVKGSYGVRFTGLNGYSIVKYGDAVELQAPIGGVMDPELEKRFQKLMVDAQKAVVLQKLQAAGKVSQVRQVRGGTTLKVTI
jgi:hypothetical protein